MATCKECLHNEMCYATHTDESPACCDYNAAQKWIPVTERLPDERIAVIVWSAAGFSTTAHYIGNEGKWRVTWNHERLEAPVTHWIPLPEPPKGE